MKRIGLTVVAILLVASPLFSQYAIISETKIAFASNRDGNFEIYIMNLMELFKFEDHYIVIN